MSIGTIPIPQGASIDDQPAQQSSPVPIPDGATIDTPDQPGEVTNDVGNKVFTPTDGENFADTVKRAVAYQNSLTPDQRQTEIGKESATIPAKTAQTLASAALIGVAGPAAMAAPLEIHAALARGFSALVPALTRGTIALGEWAESHPMAAKAVYEGLRAAIAGTAVGAASKLVGKVIKAAPEE